MNQKKYPIRLIIVYLGLVFMLLFLCWKIVFLHLSKTDNEKTLREKGVNQSIRTVKVRGYRGNIYDRNGEVMALTVPYKDIVIDPELLIEFLSADYTNKTQQNFLKQFADLVLENKGTTLGAYKKIARIANLNFTKFRANMTALLGTKSLLIKNNNKGFSQKMARLIRAYYTRRVHRVFDRRINQKITHKIANALNLSYAQLKQALLNSKSRKQLKIRKYLNLNDKILFKTQRLIRAKQKVSYRNNRFNNKYFGGAILLSSQTKRYYPQANTSAALLGLTNTDNQGIEGIEKTYNDLLQGKDGKKLMAFSGGYEPFADVKMLDTPKQGQNLNLSIDNNIQYFAFDAIKKMVDATTATYGSAIVLKKNGEVLAMANYPSINPNDRRFYKPKLYRNRIILNAIELGSTMKPFTALLGFELKRITSAEKFDLTKAIGHIKPDRHKKLTTEQVIQKSHNLGIVSIGERITKAEMWTMFNNLGFGQNSGVLPMLENKGLLRDHKKWRTSDKRTISYGYGPMNATLAQLARAYLVFLNQGKIIDLSLVSNENTKPNSKTIFSKRAIDEMLKILDSTVSQSASGYAAQIRGHEVAGKTGTTRLLKKGGGYDDKRHSTFFAGFSPVYDPKYLVIVNIHNPKGKKQAGSNVAAPVFKNIMQNILKFEK